MTRCGLRWIRRSANVVVACLCALGVAAFGANLTVTVDNIKENKGVLRVAVYEAKHWLDGDPKNVHAGKVYDLVERKGDGPVVVDLDLEPGEYGAFVYQDVNVNFTLDKNLLGMPKEPYAFSQGYDKLRRPEFEDCKFVVGEDGAAITLALSD